jgi:hypothetical protein
MVLGQIPTKFAEISEQVKRNEYDQQRDDTDNGEKPILCNLFHRFLRAMSA